MTMTYRLEPGLYSDVLFTQMLYFNIDLAEKLENFINPKKRAADMRFFRDCLTRFTPPADELCPFFEVADNRSFSFSVLYGHMIATQEFSLDAVKACLPDAQTMVQKVRAFYLPTEAYGELTELTAIKNAINTLPSSPLVKFHMLAMMIDPQPYYDALFASLTRCEAEMEAYYKANRAQLEAAKKSIKPADIAGYMEKCHGIAGGEATRDMTFSVMLVGKNAVRYVAGTHPIIILGSEYTARMAMLISEAIQPDIVKIGKALSEEKRVTILQLLLVEQEITAQQLLRRLDLSMTATHYHLEMLMQAGMLLARNEGRTIYYSLNREFFDRAPIVFDKFNSKEHFEV
ncbi:MAG: winged helix-turn-helix transcriptional regulator [Ruminococcaceae bacterium]|nr:winged helix-turn-helix transcriptional regulator [Oscillospiraceae bacterium]